MSCIEEIIAIAEKEFENKFQLFKKYTFSVSKAQKKGIKEIEKPGVYVYCKAGKIIKIGKSNSNARKRANEHIVENTTSKDGKLEMKYLLSDNEAIILFLIVEDDSKIHWIIALEDYLEHNFKAKIPSIRRC